MLCFTMLKIILTTVFIAKIKSFHALEQGFEIWQEGNLFVRDLYLAVPIKLCRNVARISLLKKIQFTCLLRFGYSVL